MPLSARCGKEERRKTRCWILVAKAKKRVEEMFSRPSEISERKSFYRARRDAGNAVGEISRQEGKEGRLG